MVVRLLHIEDNPHDAWLIHRILREDGWEVVAQVVDDLGEFLHQIEAPWDAVLADFGLPGMSTTEALLEVRRVRPELPFVVVSGQIGEENAVALMRAGADDYVSKDFPKRLSPILSRLLATSRSRVEQKAKDRRHEDLESQFRLFFHQNLSGMAMVSPGGAIQETNQALIDLLGLDPHRLPDFWSLFASPALAQAARQTLEAGRPFGPRVIEMVRSDGKPAFLLSTFQLPGPRSLIWTNFIDHTEQQQLQKQMYQFGKLESLGEIAGGVAHEINNVLAVFLGQLSIMELESRPGDRLYDRIELLKRATKRGSAIVRQLLALARQQPSRRETFSVADLLAETLQLVKGVFSERFEFELETDSSLPELTGDRDQLVQALLNLVLNARDAMPEGGRIVLGARTLGPPDPMVRIEVSDEGTGVPPELFEKIFTPFFTTKQPGKGTGLGLSLVASIAKAHHGSVGVEPRSPHGSTFFLLLPLESEGHQELEGSRVFSEPPVLAVKDHARLLLVENEEDLLNLEAQFLTLRGYRVTQCKTAEEAWGLLQAGGQGIEALVTDLGLSGMGGEALCTLVRSLPSPPAVVVQSGNLEPETKVRLEARGVTTFLLKPFLMEDLAQTLQQVLTQKKPEGGAS